MPRKSKSSLLYSFLRSNVLLTHGIKSHTDWLRFQKCINASVLIPSPLYIVFYDPRNPVKWEICLWLAIVETSTMSKVELHVLLYTSCFSHPIDSLSVDMWRSIVTQKYSDVHLTAFVLSMPVSMMAYVF